MLQTLDKEEWKEFERFVASPYFNTHEKCKQLLKFLKTRFFKKKWKTLNIIEIEKILFKDENYNKAYIRIVISQLTQLLEKYFIQLQMEKRPFYQEHFLRNSLIEKDLYKYYEQQIKKEERTKKKLEQQEKLKKGMNYYLSEYLLSVDHFKYLQLKKARNISIEAINNTIINLDKHFLINRLHLMNNNLSIQLNLQLKSTLSFQKEINKMVSSTIFNHTPLLQSYFSALQLFLNPDKNHWFKTIQQQIRHHSKTIPKKELNELYTILINHYILKSNSSKNYYSKILELYKLMAQYDFLCPEQYITAGKFKNIVTLGCHFHEFTWTKTFIEKYKIKLSPETRNSVYHFNLGAFYFYQQEFESAQLHLIQVESFDIYYTTDVRSLLLRIYYETGQYFAIQQATTSFKDFIRKQKKSTTTFKQSYLRFISILEKLVKLKQKYTYVEKRKAQLLSKVEQHPSIFHKQWLIEKIKDL